MAIESIGGVTANTVSDIRQFGFGQEEFLRILLTQLTFQDPLKPLDNQEFMAQLAEFTSLDQTRQLNDRVDSLLTMQAAGQAIGLIGKNVEVRTDAGSEIGDVTAVTFQNTTPVLTVMLTSGEFLTDVSLSQVFLIR